MDCGMRLDRSQAYEAGHHGEKEHEGDGREGETRGRSTGDCGDAPGRPGVEGVDRGGHKFCRTDVAKLIDSAVVDYLKTRGFKQEAPDR